MSNKGWHSQWFYLKNDAATPLPEFTGRLIEEALESWRKWGVLEKNKCGRTARNNILTEALVFHQTLSTPKASYSGQYSSSTPQGRTRKIHIFPRIQ